MRILRKILFMPVLLLASIANVMAGVIKQVFSLISGIFFLLMILCLCVTVLNRAWSSMLILMALLLMGYGVLFGVVVLKVVIEEFKDYCLRKVF